MSKAAGDGYPPYNISVVVRKRAADLPELACDTGDIERLARHFGLGRKSAGCPGCNSCEKTKVQRPKAAGQP